MQSHFHESAAYKVGKKCSMSCYSCWHCPPRQREQTPPQGSHPGAGPCHRWPCPAAAPPHPLAPACGMTPPCSICILSLLQLVCITLSGEVGALKGTMASCTAACPLSYPRNDIPLQATFRLKGQITTQRAAAALTEHEPQLFQAMACFKRALPCSEQLHGTQALMGPSLPPLCGAN